MKFLRFFYRGLITGMPSIIYNPITLNSIHVPFNVLPESLYINYKLTPDQKIIVHNYITEKDPFFNMEKISIIKNEVPDYYLSLNIYNCTSPVFLNDKETTRFEINTYVKRKEKKGTLIIDYISNQLSMDPVNIIKKKSYLEYNKNEINGENFNKTILLHSKIKTNIEKDAYIFIHDDLADYSDIIFYTNGIYDKLFYDTSLTKASFKIPILNGLNFTFLNITFSTPHSVFYFENQIDFVGGVWYNVFK